MRPHRRKSVVGTVDDIDRQLAPALQGRKRTSALNAQEVEARVAGRKHEMHRDPSAGDALKIVAEIVPQRPVHEPRGVADPPADEGDAMTGHDLCDHARAALAHQ